MPPWFGCNSKCHFFAYGKYYIAKELGYKALKACKRFHDRSRAGK
jgi:hypothetical protein